jgi:hypothetical protein
MPPRPGVSRAAPAPRADRRQPEANPLGRILHRDRRQELAEEPPQQPGLALEQRLACLWILPPGLQRHPAPLRVWDAARPALEIAGMALGEAAGLVAGLIGGLIAARKW